MQQGTAQQRYTRQENPKTNRGKHQHGIRCSRLVFHWFERAILHSNKAAKRYQLDRQEGIIVL